MSLYTLKNLLKTNYVLVFFIVLLVLIVLISFTIPYIFLPLDILNYLPSYSFNIVRPNNSLLIDPIVQFEPWRIFAKRYLLNGEIPIINNFNSSGVPFLANPQTSLFYPLNFFYYLFPLEPAIFLMHFLKIYIFIFFSYLYLRTLKIKRLLSLLGSILLGTSSFLYLWLLWPHTNVFIFLPFLFYLTEKVRSRNKDYLYFVLISLGYLGAITGGHPETLFHLFIVHLMYSCVRLWNYRNKLFGVIIFVFLGILLGSFLIFPFIEYLLNSFAFFSRNFESSAGTLPLVSLVFLIFPFILGSPSLEYYITISPYTNFQEASGLYVGLPLLIIGVYALIKLKKDNLYLSYLLIIIVVLGFSFNLFPFNIIDKLPILRASSEQRLIGFFTFGLTVLATYYINSLTRIKKNKKIKSLRRILITLFAVLLPLVVIAQSYVGNLISFVGYQEFLNIILNYFYILILATVLSFIFLLSYLISKRSLYLVASFFILYVISYLFLFNYNTFTPSRYYYPKTDLVKYVQLLKPGSYLQVGNPSIQENTNLVYGLSNAENYDALEFKKYKDYFDKNFPIKNQWGRVDAITVESLDNLKIKYVISDYDLRFNKSNIFPGKDDALDPITIEKDFNLKFTSPITFHGIRIIPATFDRINNCYLSFSISKDQEILSQKSIPCELFDNNYFYNIDFGQSFDKGEYTLSVSSSSRLDNSVSFFGKNNLPYLDLLGSEKLDINLILLEKVNNYFVFRNNSTKPEYELQKLHDSATRKIYLVNTKKPKLITFPIVNYPGWNIRVNNSEVVPSSSVFLSAEVNRGQSLVVLDYESGYYALGKIVSLFVFLTLFVYLLRNINKEPKIINFLESFRNKVLETGIYEHIVVLFISIVLSLSLILTIYNYFNLKFNVPFTTAINWHTVNNYPKQQDTFYFLSSYVFIFVSSIIIWFLYICRKK